MHHLGRELLQERTKVKALSEELENPLNVHRWQSPQTRSPCICSVCAGVPVLTRRTPPPWHPTPFPFQAQLQLQKVHQ